MNGNTIHIGIEDLKKLYDRYQNNEHIAVLAGELGRSDSWLRNKFRENGLLLRKHKSCTGKVTPENSNIHILIATQQKKVVPKLCGNCIRRLGGAIGNKYCDECYGTKDKPNFKRDTRYK